MAAEMAAEMAEQAWHYMVVIVDAHSNYRMWNSNERKPLDELGEQGGTSIRCFHRKSGERRVAW
jgi:hypothetical protein